VSAVLITVEGAIGYITLNRPDVMNAVTVELASQLEQALHDLDARAVVRVIMIRGAGGNFCAGGDFKEVERLRAEGPAALDTLFTAFRRALGAIAKVAVPVVAVVEGNAMAGGFELIQAADITLARDDARLSDNHVNFAMVPGGGGSQRLPRLLGPQRALAHLLTGERLSGREAFSLGLVHRAFAPEDFEDGVASFVSRLAAKDAGAVRTIKRLVYDGLALDLAGGLDLEQRTVVDHIVGQVVVS